MKTKKVFVCSDCGSTSAKWQGRCPACSSWNTMVEEIIHKEHKSVNQEAKLAAKPQPITAIAHSGQERFVFDISELDTVLGGGLVPGSSLLLGGEPGIGKSTLLLQMAGYLGEKYGTVLYITGEESPQQIKMRGERLSSLSRNIFVLAENNLTLALEQAAQMELCMVIIDSVQAVYIPELDSSAGSVSQVRACTAAALEYARNSSNAVILVGHVTKEGVLAGPRVLEHMVDTVLYFEGERYTSLRLLRGVKNRFGSTNEVGVFEMSSQGLTTLSEPSRFFLSQRTGQVSGSAVTCVMQGTRPMLLEAQALVAPTSFGNPRRLATGFDYNRLLLIIAVLERKAGFALGNKDIYLNIAGGLKVDDPAADLAVAAAIASSFRDFSIEDELIIIGELGLLGEIRSVAQIPRRLRESSAMGFKAALVPENQEQKSAKIKQLQAKDLNQALSILGLKK